MNYISTPIVFIHGYGSEGRDTTASEIYGDLPQQVIQSLGQNVVNINLSRWISLSDGINLEDVSFALDRALKSPEYAHLLTHEFRCIIHSTGALVVRHWVKHYSPKPSPLQKIIYLAGALFGSGLAHMGRGQLSRWGSILFKGTQTGLPSLRDLEFGANDTLDLHQYFLQPKQHMRNDYGIYEYCMIGSQTMPAMRMIPNRYVKEDSSDCTLRTASGNLNFNYFTITPRTSCYNLSTKDVHEHVLARRANQTLPSQHYRLNKQHQADNIAQTPFALLYETSHIGNDTGIVDGSKNRPQVLPRLKEALLSANTPKAQQQLVHKWHGVTEKTLSRAAKLKRSLGEWDPQSQYEAHAQVVFRVRDQFGHDIKEHDITFKVFNTKQGLQLPRLIEDKTSNPRSAGNTTYYFRVQEYIDGEFKNRLDNIVPVTLEITGVEPNSASMQYLPVMLKFSEHDLRDLIQPFRTTILDVTLLRLPSDSVFAITPHLH